MQIIKGQLRKLITTRVDPRHHAKLQRFARQNRTSIDRLLAERIVPWIDELPDDDQEGG